MSNTSVSVNTSIDPAAPDIAVDRIFGVDYQRVKANWGPEGAIHDTADVDGERLPVGGAQVGALTESAPASDTASAGLNGRLQRIAQRLTSLIALLPTTLTALGALRTGPTESVITATVPIGGNATPAIDTAGARNLGLIVPTTFDGTLIAFQVSTDGTNFFTLFDITNTQVTMTVTAGRAYDLPGELMAWRYFFIATGTVQATTTTAFLVALRS